MTAGKNNFRIPLNIRKDGKSVTEESLERLKLALECSGYEASSWLEDGCFVVGATHPDMGASSAWNMPKRFPEELRSAELCGVLRRCVEKCVPDYDRVPPEWTCLSPAELLSKTQGGETVFESSIRKFSEEMGMSVRSFRCVGACDETDGEQVRLATDILSWSSLSDEPKGTLLVANRFTGGASEIFRVADGTCFGHGCHVWRSVEGAPREQAFEMPSDEAFAEVERLVAEEGYSVDKGFVPAPGLSAWSLFLGVKLLSTVCLEVFLSEDYAAAGREIPVVERYARAALRIPEVFSDHSQIDLPPELRLNTPDSSMYPVPEEDSFPERIARLLVFALDSVEKSGSGHARKRNVFAAWGAFSESCGKLSPEDAMRFDMFFLREFGGMDVVSEATRRIAALAAFDTAREYSGDADLPPL